WQHRWDSLSMDDVHRVASLPGWQLPEAEGPERANEFVPRYFAEYERRFALPVLRPVRVRTVRDGVDPDDDRLHVVTDAGTWTTRAVVNATGTWERPFVPWYPGIETFRGRQLHTADYDGPEELAGKRVVVVGGGHSAVQLLAEISEVADTVWVTRRPPQWRTGDGFGEQQGRAAVAQVEERVRAGLPPQSVVAVTGLLLRAQEREAAARGVYARRPMFARIVPDGVEWSDGRCEPADVILWATGFRAALGHLGPLRLREPSGGVRMEGTRTARDPRVHLLGYGPSASTIGGNRAGLAAARDLRRRRAGRAESAA
ncbi:MAG: NAD(P)-binding domain-containing protein, partial [Actinomycetota bacterium]|nr:NAD(P)-binding domain-containing protein [Actinomycetota bacterium]